MPQIVVVFIVLEPPDERAIISTPLFIKKSFNKYVFFMHKTKSLIRFVFFIIYKKPAQ